MLLNSYFPKKLVPQRATIGNLYKSSKLSLVVKVHSSTLEQPYCSETTSFFLKKLYFFYLSLRNNNHLMKQRSLVLHKIHVCITKSCLNLKMLRHTDIYSLASKQICL